MSTEVRSSLDTHKAITAHYVELASQYKDLQLDAASYSSTSASGSAAYVFVYLQVSCTFAFSNCPRLSFEGKGGVLGLGATGSLGGSGTFNIDPNSLKGMSGITFEAFGASIGAGGFQVTFYHNHSYIGHAEFYGAGVSLGTPGGGTGKFS